MKSGQIFERTEKKYIVSDEQKQELLRRGWETMSGDEFGKSTICSIYFDTTDHRLIRQSLEKPLYKEKLRLRSYGVPTDSTKVFLELKKKYKEVVYKRREDMTLHDAEVYFDGGPPPADTQIMREIDWMIHFYGDMKPAVYIAYDREAFVEKNGGNLRITFDSNLIYRTEDLTLESGIYGKPLIDDSQYVMEIKTDKAMPLWLADALDDMCIYPATFSKYGTAYQNNLGGNPCLKQYSSRFLPTHSPSAVICSVH